MNYEPGPMVTTHLTFKGALRVYFNRHSPDGVPWCVCPDSVQADGVRWEIAVRDVMIRSSTHTVYRPKSTPDEDDGRPSAWVATRGVLTVYSDGHALIAVPDAGEL